MNCSIFWAAAVTPSEKSLQKGQGLVLPLIGKHHKVKELLLTNQKPCQEPLAH